MTKKKTEKTSIEKCEKLTKGSKQKDSTTSSKKRKVSHAGARQKGLQFERDCANQMGHIFPEVKRRLESQASEAQEKCDLDNTDIFKFQMKNHQGYCSISTINEVKIRDPKHIPVLVTKGNKLEAMAVLPFDKLVTLLEIAYGLALPLNEKPHVKQLRHEKSSLPEVATELKSLAELPFVIEYATIEKLEEIYPKKTFSSLI